MHLLRTSITVQNTHNETVTIDIDSLHTLGMKAFDIVTEKPIATFLPHDPRVYLVKRGEQRFYINEQQLTQAFSALPKVRTGHCYRVLKDTHRVYAMINSRPVIKPLRAGDRVVCGDNFRFRFADEARQDQGAFALGETVDGCFYGSQAYYDPDFYALVS
jgi:hypothetical protein